MGLTDVNPATAVYHPESTHGYLVGVRKISLPHDFAIKSQSVGAVQVNNQPSVLLGNDRRVMPANRTIS